MVLTIRVDLSLYLAIFLGLIIFGMGYNALVAWLERKGYLEGYLSLVVALGVAITLIPLAILSWQFVLLALGAFIASGLPMIVGSIWRYIDAREKAKQSIKEEIK